MFSINYNSFMIISPIDIHTLSLASSVVGAEQNANEISKREKEDTQKMARKSSFFGTKNHQKFMKINVAVAGARAQVVLQKQNTQGSEFDENKGSKVDIRA